MYGMQSKINQILRGAETIKRMHKHHDTPVPISDRNERCPNCEARLSDRPEDKGKVTWMCFSWRGARVYQSYLCREITRRIKAEAEVERLLTISKIIVEYISDYEPRQFYRDLINQNN